MTKDEIEKGCKLCASASDYSNCNDCPSYANCVSAAAYNLIIEQEKDINQLKTECTLLDDELRIARQLKGNIKNAIDTYYNSQGGSYYSSEDVINDIDKIRKAVREFAGKVKAKSEMFLVAKDNGVYGEKPYVSIEKIDELLKEYF